MLIELVGPQAVGKSTVAARIAGELALACHSGQGFHGLDGVALTAEEVRSDRRAAVRHRPDLLARTLITSRGPLRLRWRCALNVTRREHFASRVGSGVLESGPVHGLCQFGATYGFDLSGLAPLVTDADIYVRLDADPNTILDRWADRENAPGDRAAQLDWIERYGSQLDRALLHRNVITVDAGGDVDGVVARAVAAIRRPATL